MLLLSWNKDNQLLYIFASISLLYVHLTSWSTFCALDVKSYVPTSANLSGAVGSVMDFNAKAKSSTPGDPWNTSSLASETGGMAMVSDVSVGQYETSSSSSSSQIVGNKLPVWYPYVCTIFVYTLIIEWSLSSGLLNLRDLGLFIE